MILKFFPIFFLSLCFSAIVFAAPAEEKNISTSEGALCNGSLQGLPRPMPRALRPYSQQNPYVRAFRRSSSITKKDIYMTGFKLLALTHKFNSSVELNMSESIYLSKVTGRWFPMGQMITEAEVLAVLVNAHHRLVFGYLEAIMGDSKLLGQSNEREDVLQILMEALPKAIYEYVKDRDTMEDFHFSTIAIYVFRQALNKRLLFGGVGVQKPSVGLAIRKLQEVEDGFFPLERVPSAKELLEAYNLKFSKPITMPYLKAMLSLKEFDHLEDDEKFRYQDPWALDSEKEQDVFYDQATSEISPEEFADKLLLREGLEEAMAAVLDERQVMLLRLRFGIGRDVTSPESEEFLMSLAELAQLFDVSRERVRKIQANAFRDLRYYFFNKTHAGAESVEKSP